MSEDRRASARLRWRLGRILIALNYLSILAVATCSWTGSLHFADPTWQMHARFHLLWQTQIAVLAGLAGLWSVGRHWEPGPQRAWVGLLPLGFWLTQITSGVGMRLAAQGPLEFDGEHSFLGFPAMIASVLPVLCLALVGALLDRHDASRARALAAPMPDCEHDDSLSALCAPQSLH